MKKSLTLFITLSVVLPFAARSQYVPDNVKDDDPRARADYELARLRDPKTGRIPDDIVRKERDFAKTLPTRESLGSRYLKGGGPKSLQSLSWSLRGPANVGGRTRALGVDVTNQNVILAGGVSGGLWRTSNGGSTWTLVSGLSNLHSVSCIAQDTRAGHTNTWYYGTGELDGNSASGGGGPYRGDGYYKSTDNGQTWTKLASTSSGTPEHFDNGFDYTWKVAIDPSNLAQDEVYAATFGAISRSTNGGTTWTTVLGGYSTVENNGTEFSRYSDVVVTSTGIVYAALSQRNQAGTASATEGIWRSTDGISWTNITDISFPVTFGRVVLGIPPSNETVVYILAETPGSGFQTTYAGANEAHSFFKYVYLSGDGSGAGGSWEDRSGNLPAFGQPVGQFASQGGYDLVIQVKPDDENVVFIGGTDLFRSTDGFATTGNTAWIGGYATANNVSQYPNHHPDQHAIVFSPGVATTTMWSGNDGGVQMTTGNMAGSVSWTWLNNGYNTSQFYTIAIPHGSTSDVIIGGTQDNGTWYTGTTDAGTAWSRLRGGDGTYCAIADDDTSYYVSVPASNTYRFIVHGGGVSSFTRVDPVGGAGYLFVNPFILDPNNTARMYMAGGTRVWRNDDLTGIPLGSNSTTAVNWTNMTNTNVAGSTVTALAVSKVPANRLYYGRSNGHVFRVDGANVGDPAQTDVTGGNFPSGAYVSSIAIDPTNSSKVLVTFSNYLLISAYYSADSGSTWTAVAGNLEQNPDGSGNGPSLRWAKIIPGAYYVGTSTGLYSTTALNGGSTVWALEGSSTIGNAIVDMIDFRSADGRIVVGTHGSGIYSSVAIINPPDAPVLISPPDSATNQLTSLRMTWHSALTATGYDLQVSTDSLFGSVAYEDSTLTDTSTVAGPFVNFTKHFWRVRAKNVLGWGSWSGVWRFTTGFTVTSTTVTARWNLASVPVQVLDYRKSVLFPSATSPAYAYEGGVYVIRDTLKNKPGYWLKFPSDSTISMTGTLIASDTFSVSTGWNLVGSISTPISQFSATSDPGGIIASNFFEYDHGYVIADSIRPLRGHWVKASAPGSIFLSAGGGLVKQQVQLSLRELNAIQIADAAGNHRTLYFGRNPGTAPPAMYELPPLAPEGAFDVRFASNRMAEFEKTGSYPVMISSAVYPVTVSWTTNRQPYEAALKVGSRRIPIQTYGSVQLRSPSDGVTLQLGKDLPQSFSLGQNYPNPFNPSTTISYSLPVDARVTLTVYTLLGQKVRILFDNESQEAGYKSVNFNAGTHNRGAYFHRLHPVSTGDQAKA